MIERFLARIGTLGAILILAAVVVLVGFGGMAIDHFSLAAQHEQQQGEQDESGSQEKDQSGTQDQSQNGGKSTEASQKGAQESEKGDQETETDAK